MNGILKKQLRVGMTPRHFYTIARSCAIFANRAMLCLLHNSSIKFTHDFQKCFFFK